MKSHMQMKPCPFCGGDVKMSGAPLTGSLHILCKQCGLDAYFFGQEYNMDGMRAKWEKRVKENNNDE